jgi:HNH endonuclease
MREINLSKNKVTIVDDEDYERLIKLNWYVTLNCNNWYAVIRRFNKPLYLHRYLLSPGKNLVVDHINMNTLDNQKCNLRIVTQGYNIQNKPKLKTNTSGYKGVQIRNDRPSSKYRAKIDFNGKQIYIGSYPTLIEAAKAYDIEALKLYGANANLNFKKEDYENLSFNV